MVVRRFLIASILVAGVSAEAQEFDLEGWSVEGGASTLGFYIAPSYEFMPNFRARAPLYFFSLSDTGSVDGNEIDGKLEILSMAAMADYFPFGDGVRVSGGLAFGGYRLEGETDELTLDGNSYTGDFEAVMEQESAVAPVVSVGFQRNYPNWGISTELGARITTLDLSTSGQEALSDADRDQFEDDLAELNDDLDAVPVIPFFSMGVNFRF